MTFFELLYLLILIGVGIAVGKLFGELAGIIVGILAAVGLVYLTKTLGQAGLRRRCRKMAEKYTRLFRVCVVPTDEKSIIKPNRGCSESHFVKCDFTGESEDFHFCGAKRHQVIVMWRNEGLANA